MNLPVLAIAAACSSGILLGLLPGSSSRAAHGSLLLFIEGSVFVLAVSGLIALGQQPRLPNDEDRGDGKNVWVAAAVSVVAWIGLGILAACLVEQPLPPSHVLSRFAAQEIP